MTDQPAHRPDVLQRTTPTWQRHLAFVVAVALIATSWPSPELFAAGSAAPLPAPRASTGPVDLARLDLSSLSVPAELGDIVERWQPQGRVPRALIVHIQDLHTQPEAQRHIAALIGYLHEKFGIELVALEGAEGLCDTDLYAELPDAAATERVARLFLENGLFSGAEYYAITHPHAVTLWGAEDAATYLAHLRTYQEGARASPVAAEIVQHLRAVLVRARAALYPQTLLQLIAAREAYARGGEEQAFRSYVSGLRRVAMAQRLSLEPYPHIELYRQAEQSYAHLDFRAIESDRNYLRQALLPQLTREERREFLSESGESVKTGTSEEADERLAELAQHYGVLDRSAETDEAPFSAVGFLLALMRGLPAQQHRYTAFRRYLAYLILSKQVHSTALRNELEALEETVQERFLTTDRQRALAHLLKQCAILDELIHAQLSPEHYQYYQRHRGELTTPAIWRALEQVEPHTSSHALTRPHLDQLMGELPIAERFYLFASQRNDILTRNLARQLDDRDESSAILVTGGFHTPGITQRLRDRGIAYLVISPTVSTTMNDQTYQARLENRTPTMDELLRQLNRQTLAPVLRTGAMAGRLPAGLPEQPLLPGTVQAGAATSRTLKSVTLFLFVGLFAYLFLRHAGVDGVHQLLAWMQAHASSGLSLAQSGHSFTLSGLGDKVDFNLLPSGAVAFAMATTPPPTGPGKGAGQAAGAPISDAELARAGQLLSAVRAQPLSKGLKRSLQEKAKAVALVLEQEGVRAAAARMVSRQLVRVVNADKLGSATTWRALASLLLEDAQRLQTEAKLSPRQIDYVLPKLSPNGFLALLTELQAAELGRGRSFLVSVLDRADLAGTARQYLRNFHAAMDEAIKQGAADRARTIASQCFFSPDEEAARARVGQLLANFRAAEDEVIRHGAKAIARMIATRSFNVATEAQARERARWYLWNYYAVVDEVTQHGAAAIAATVASAAFDTTDEVAARALARQYLKNYHAAIDEARHYASQDTNITRTVAAASFAVADEAAARALVRWNLWNYYAAVEEVIRLGSPELAPTIGLRCVRGVRDEAAARALAGQLLKNYRAAAERVAQLGAPEHSMTIANASLAAHDEAAARTLASRYLRQYRAAMDEAIQLQADAIASTVADRVFMGPNEAAVRTRARTLVNDWRQGKAIHHLPRDQDVTVQEFGTETPLEGPGDTEPNSREAGAVTVRVRIPAPLRRFTGGAEEVPASGVTVGAMIDDLERRHPGIKERLVDAQGRLWRFTQVYVNDEPATLETALTEGDQVALVPAIAGGAGTKEEEEAAAPTASVSMRNGLKYPLALLLTPGRSRVRQILNVAGFLLFLSSNNYLTYALVLFHVGIVSNVLYGMAVSWLFVLLVKVGTVAVLSLAEKYIAAHLPAAQWSELEQYADQEFEVLKRDAVRVPQRSPLLAAGLKLVSGVERGDMARVVGGGKNVRARTIYYPSAAAIPRPVVWRVWSKWILRYFIIRRALGYLNDSALASLERENTGNARPWWWAAFWVGWGNYELLKHNRYFGPYAPIIGIFSLLDALEAHSRFLWVPLLRLARYLLRRKNEERMQHVGSIPQHMTEQMLAPEAIKGVMRAPATAPQTSAERVSSKEPAASGAAAPVRVRIPAPLRRFTDGAAEVGASGTTVGAMIDDIERHHPGIKARLVDAQGHLRRGVIHLIRLGETPQDVWFLDGLATSIPAGAEVQLLSPIAGGAGTKEEEEAARQRAAMAPATNEPPLTLPATELGLNRVLVVDDNPSALSSIVQELRGRGVAEVLVAQSGHQALDVLRRERKGRRRVDGVLTDLNMPDGDGEVLVSTMVQEGLLSPAIVWSAGKLDPAVGRDLLNFGAAAVLEKRTEQIDPALQLLAELNRARQSRTAPTTPVSVETMGKPKAATALGALMAGGIAGALTAAALAGVVAATDVIGVIPALVLAAVVGLIGVPMTVNFLTAGAWIIRAFVHEGGIRGPDGRFHLRGLLVTPIATPQGEHPAFHFLPQRLQESIRYHETQHGLWGEIGAHFFQALQLPMITLLTLPPIGYVIAGAALFTFGLDVMIMAGHAGAYGDSALGVLGLVSGAMVARFHEPLRHGLERLFSVLWPSELLRRVRARLVTTAQQYLDRLSEGDDVTSRPPDVFLLLGNPDLRAFLEFAKAWHVMADHGRPVPIVLAGGRGRGAVPLIEQAIAHYRSRGQLREDDAQWLESAKTDQLVNETDILRFILEREGVPIDVLKVEEAPSVNSAQNFRNSSNVIDQLMQKQGIKSPRIGIVTSPMLLLRARATARKIWQGTSWEALRFKAYHLDARQLSDADLIELIGYAAGYPASSAAEYPELNTNSELRGTQAENNPNVVTELLTAGDWALLENTRQAFKAFLDVQPLRYDPQRGALVPARGNRPRTASAAPPRGFTINAPEVRRFNPDGVAAVLAVSEKAFDDRSGESRLAFVRVPNQILLDGQEVSFSDMSRVNALKEDVDELVNHYTAAHPDEEVLAVLPNGNLGFDEWFVGMANGVVYHQRGEPLDQRRYDMLVTKHNGTVSVMTLQFAKKRNLDGREVWRALNEHGEDITDQITAAVYGQRIVKDGEVNVDALAAQFHDLRHLFRLPYFQAGSDQIHLGFNDGGGELLQDHRQRVRQALRGEPITLDLDPLRKKGISDEKRETIFAAWGYRNVTGRRDAASLRPGEYVVDNRNTQMTIVLLPGTHPHSFFGQTADGKIVTGYVPGTNHVAGTTILGLAQALQQQGLKDAFLWANGKDAFVQYGAEAAQGAEGARRSNLEVLLIVRKQPAVAEPEPAQGSALWAQQRSGSHTKLASVSDTELGTWPDAPLERSPFGPRLQEFARRRADLQERIAIMRPGSALELIRGLQRQLAEVATRELVLVQAALGDNTRDGSELRREIVELKDEAGDRAPRVQQLHETLYESLRDGFRLQARKAQLEALTQELRLLREQAVHGSSEPVQQQTRQRRGEEILETQWFRAGHPAGGYHQWLHSKNVGELAYLLAKGRGVSEEDAVFLAQVGWIHDFDPERPTGVRPRVPSTLKLLAGDFSGERGLDGTPGRSILREVFGWDERRFWMALAIIQRSEFPFGKEHHNPAYVGSSPLARYRALLLAMAGRSDELDDAERAFVLGLTGQMPSPPFDEAEVRFILSEAPIFSEYADKMNWVVMTDLIGLIETTRGLADEINVEQRGTGKPEMTLAGLHPYQFQLGIGERENFTHDLEVAAELGMLKGMKWPDRDAAVAVLPIRQRHAYAANLAGLEAFWRTSQAHPYDRGRAMSAGVTAARQEAYGRLEAFLASQGPNRPFSLETIAHAIGATVDEARIRVESYQAEYPGHVFLREDGKYERHGVFGAATPAEYEPPSGAASAATSSSAVSDTAQAGPAPAATLLERAAITQGTSTEARINTETTPRILTQEEIKRLVTSTPETQVYLHRTYAEEARGILKSGLSVRRYGYDLLSTATASSMDAREAFDEDYMTFRREKRKGKPTTHVVVIEIPKAELAATGYQGVSAQTETWLEQLHENGVSPEPAVPPQFIRGFIEKATGEFTPNPAFTAAGPAPKGQVTGQRGAITVSIPAPLRRYTGGAEEVEAGGATVGAMIEDLERRHPGIKARLVDAQGHLRRGVIHLIRPGETPQDVWFLDGLATSIPAGAEVQLLSPIAGGAPTEGEEGSSTSPAARSSSVRRWLIPHYEEKRQIVAQLKTMGMSDIRNWHWASVEYLEDVRWMLEQFPREELSGLKGIQFVPWHRSLMFFIGAGGFYRPNKETLRVVLFPNRTVFQWAFAHELSHAILMQPRYHKTTTRLATGTWRSVRRSMATEALLPIFFMVGEAAAALTLYVRFMQGISMPWPLLPLSAVPAVAISVLTGGLFARVASFAWSDTPTSVFDASQPWSVLTLYSIVSPEEEAADLLATALLFPRAFKAKAAANPALRVKYEILRDEVFKGRDPAERPAHEEPNTSMRAFPARLFLLLSVALHAWGLFALIPAHSVAWTVSIFNLALWAGVIVTWSWLFQRPVVPLAFSLKLSRRWPAPLRHVIRQTIASSVSVVYESARLGVVALVALLLLHPTWPGTEIVTLMRRPFHAQPTPTPIEVNLIELPQPPLGVGTGKKETRVVPWLGHYLDSSGWTYYSGKDQNGKNISAKFGFFDPFNPDYFGGNPFMYPNAEFQHMQFGIASFEVQDMLHGGGHPDTSRSDLEAFDQLILYVADADPGWAEIRITGSTDSLQAWHGVTLDKVWLNGGAQQIQIPIGKRLQEHPELQHFLSLSISFGILQGNPQALRVLFDKIELVPKGMGEGKGPTASPEAIPTPATVGRFASPHHSERGSTILPVLGGLALGLLSVLLELHGAWAAEGPARNSGAWAAGLSGLVAAHPVALIVAALSMGVMGFVWWRRGRRAMAQFALANMLLLSVFTGIVPVGLWSRPAEPPRSPTPLVPAAAAARSLQAHLEWRLRSWSSSDLVAQFADAHSDKAADAFQRVLEERNDPASIPLLGALLNETGDRRLEERIVTMLTIMGRSDAVPLLRAFSGEHRGTAPQDDLLRLRALAAAVYLSGREISPRADVLTAIRLRALAGLEQLHDASLSPAQATAANDELQVWLQAVMRERARLAPLTAHLTSTGLQRLADKEVPSDWEKALEGYLQGTEGDGPLLKAIVLAIARAESSLQPKAKSSSGAVGLLQTKLGAFIDVLHADRALAQTFADTYGGVFKRLTTHRGGPRGYLIEARARQRDKPALLRDLQHAFERVAQDPETSLLIGWKYFASYVSYYQAHSLTEWQAVLMALAAYHDGVGTIDAALFGDVGAKRPGAVPASVAPRVHTFDELLNLRNRDGTSVVSAEGKPYVGKVGALVLLAMHEARNTAPARAIEPRSVSVTSSAEQGSRRGAQSGSSAWFRLRRMMLSISVGVIGVIVTGSPAWAGPTGLQVSSNSVWVAALGLGLVIFSVMILGRVRSRLSQHARTAFSWTDAGSLPREQDAFLHFVFWSLALLGIATFVAWFAPYATTSRLPEVLSISPGDVIRQLPLDPRSQLILASAASFLQPFTVGMAKWLGVGTVSGRPTSSGPMTRAATFEVLDQQTKMLVTLHYVSANQLMGDARRRASDSLRVWSHIRFTEVYQRLLHALDAAPDDAYAQDVLSQFRLALSPDGNVEGFALVSLPPWHHLTLNVREVQWDNRWDNPEGRRFEGVGSGLLREVLLELQSRNQVGETVYLEDPSPESEAMYKRRLGTNDLHWRIVRESPTEEGHRYLMLSPDEVARLIASHLVPFPDVAGMVARRVRPILPRTNPEGQPLTVYCPVYYPSRPGEAVAHALQATDAGRYVFVDPHGEFAPQDIQATFDAIETRLKQLGTVVGLTRRDPATAVFTLQLAGPDGQPQPREVIYYAGKDARTFTPTEVGTAYDVLYVEDSPFAHAWGNLFRPLETLRPGGYAVLVHTDNLAAYLRANGASPNVEVQAITQNETDRRRYLDGGEPTWSRWISQGLLVARYQPRPRRGTPPIGGVAEEVPQPKAEGPAPATEAEPVGSPAEQAAPDSPESGRAAPPDAEESTGPVVERLISDIEDASMKLQGDENYEPNRPWPVVIDTAVLELLDTRGLFRGTTIIYPAGGLHIRPALFAPTLILNKEPLRTMAERFIGPEAGSEVLQRNLHYVSEEDLDALDVASYPRWLSGLPAAHKTLLVKGLYYAYFGRRVGPLTRYFEGLDRLMAAGDRVIILTQQDAEICVPTLRALGYQPIDDWLPEPQRQRLERALARVRKASLDDQRLTYQGVHFHAPTAVVIFEKTGTTPQGGKSNANIAATNRESTPGESEPEGKAGASQLVPPKESDILTPAAPAKPSEPVKGRADTSSKGPTDTKGFNDTKHLSSLGVNDEGFLGNDLNDHQRAREATGGRRKGPPPTPPATPKTNVAPPTAVVQQRWRTGDQVVTPEGLLGTVMDDEAVPPEGTTEARRVRVKLARGGEVSTYVRPGVAGLRSAFQPGYMVLVPVDPPQRGEIRSVRIRSDGARRVLVRIDAWTTGEYSPDQLTLLFDSHGRPLRATSAPAAGPGTAPSKEGAGGVGQGARDEAPAPASGPGAINNVSLESLPATPPPRPIIQATYQVFDELDKAIAWLEQSLRPTDSVMVMAHYHLPVQLVSRDQFVVALRRLRQTDVTKTGRRMVVLSVREVDGVKRYAALLSESLTRESPASEANTITVYRGSSVALTRTALRFGFFAIPTRFMFYDDPSLILPGDGPARLAFQLPVFMLLEGKLWTVNGAETTFLPPGAEAGFRRAGSMIAVDAQVDLMGATLPQEVRDVLLDEAHRDVTGRDAMRAEAILAAEAAGFLIRLDPASIDTVRTRQLLEEDLTARQTDSGEAQEVRNLLERITGNLVPSTEGTGSAPAPAVPSAVSDTALNSVSDTAQAGPAPASEASPESARGTAPSKEGAGVAGHGEARDTTPTTDQAQQGWSPRTTAVAATPGASGWGVPDATALLPLGLTQEQVDQANRLADELFAMLIERPFTAPREGAFMAIRQALRAPSDSRALAVMLETFRAISELGRSAASSTSPPDVQPSEQAIAVLQLLLQARSEKAVQAVAMRMLGALSELIHQALSDPEAARRAKAILALQELSIQFSLLSAEGLEQLANAMFDESEEVRTNAIEALGYVVSNMRTRQRLSSPLSPRVAASILALGLWQPWRVAQRHFAGRQSHAYYQVLLYGLPIRNDHAFTRALQQATREVAPELTAHFEERIRETLQRQLSAEVASNIERRRSETDGALKQLERELLITSSDHTLARAVAFTYARLYVRTWLRWAGRQGGSTGMAREGVVTSLTELLTYRNREVREVASWLIQELAKGRTGLVPGTKGADSAPAPATEAEPVGSPAEQVRSHADAVAIARLTRWIGQGGVALDAQTNRHIAALLERLRSANMLRDPSALMDALELTAIHSGLPPIQCLELLLELSMNGVTPMDLAARFDAVSETIRLGGFNANDLMHLAVSFVRLQPEERSHPLLSVSPLSFDGFRYGMQALARRGSWAGGLTESDRAELIYLAYEAVRLKTFLDRLKAHLAGTSRPLVVVENRSYGATALCPVRDELLRDGVRIMSAKVGSTESHANPFALNPELFSDEELRFILERQPVVAVVDGSKRERYPRAYRGYLNFFLALELLTNGRDVSAAEHSLGSMDRAFIERFAATRPFLELKARVRALGISPETAHYRLAFWQPGVWARYVDDPWNAEHRFPPTVGLNEVQGPTLIITQTASEDAAIPAAIKAMGQGVRHDPAHFDDTIELVRLMIHSMEDGPHVSGDVAVAYARAQVAAVRRALGTLAPTVPSTVSDTAQAGPAPASEASPEPARGTAPSKEGTGGGDKASAPAVAQETQLGTPSPELSREDTAEELLPGVDRRPIEHHLLNIGHVRYAMAVKQVINPKNNPTFTAVYGGAGVGLSEFLLSTNARYGYFVSHYRELTVDDLRDLLKNPNRYVRAREEAGYQLKYFMGHARSNMLGTKEEILGALAYELLGIGVALDRVRVDEDAGHPRIRFPWAYHGQAEFPYAITFIEGNITMPSEYPEKLQAVLRQGIDAYFQKAGVTIPDYYADFIPTLYDAMKPGGFFATDDIAHNPLTPQHEPDEYVNLTDRFPIALPIIALPNAQELERGIHADDPFWFADEDLRIAVTGQREDPHGDYGRQVTLRKKDRSSDGTPRRPN